MAFSINQVRHLFVANTPKASDAAVEALGDTKVAGVAGQHLYVQHFGHGGVVSSDKVDVQNIMYAKVTSGEDLNTPLYKHTLTVTDAQAGQIYVVKVFVQNYIGLGVQDNATRVATYYAPANASAASVAKGLRVAFRKALGFQVSDTETSEASADDAAKIENYREQMFTVTGTGATVVVSEVASYWELGKFPVGRTVRIPKDGVILGDIADAAGVLYNTWGTVEYAQNGTAGDATKKLADLEYFCMGARGDEYRQMGFPYNIDTKYQVDIDEDYDVIDIHYFYQGSNESVQKSEKDLTILVPAGDDTLVNAINTLTGFAEGDPRYLVATE